MKNCLNTSGKPPRCPVTDHFVDPTRLFRLPLRGAKARATHRANLEKMLHLPQTEAGEVSGAVEEAVNDRLEHELHVVARRAGSDPKRRGTFPRHLFVEPKLAVLPHGTTGNIAVEYRGSRLLEASVVPFRIRPDSSPRGGTRIAPAFAFGQVRRVRRRRPLSLTPPLRSRRPETEVQCGGFTWRPCGGCGFSRSAVGRI